MRVTTISYKKIIPIAPFVNDTIGVEIQVDPTDNPEAAFKYAKSIVNEWANGKKEPVAEVIPTSIPEINLAEERISIAIENAVTLDQLNKLAPNLPINLQKIFEKRLNELQPK